MKQKNSMCRNRTAVVRGAQTHANNSAAAGWTRVVSDEEGGAYTLSYVMVVPILMLLVCVVVETTMMMTAKLGTVYAAYAGARAGVVWSSAGRDWSSAESRIRQAAIQAMVPFASGSGGSPTNDADINSERLAAYLETYRGTVESPGADSYVRAKYQHANSALTVTTDGPPRRWDSDLTVKVVYQFPFQVPGIGRIFGSRGADGNFYYPLISQVTLRNEAPQNTQQRLGIGYGMLPE